MLGVLLAVAAGLAVFAGAVYLVRLMATPQPPEPDPEEIQAVEASYKCTICGLRLTVTHAQDQAHEAPRHCREEMVEVP